MTFNIFSKRIKTLSAVCVSVIALAGLNACESTTVHLKERQLNRIALPVFMIKRDIAIEGANLVAFERVHDPLKVVQVYIEDDSSAGDRIKHTAINSKDPSDPLALRLAAQDKNTNVVYLSAPCSYLRDTMFAEGPANKCAKHYYSDGPVSQNVIDAYGAALDNIRRYHDVDSFVLNGYGSGASVAAILASQRMDVDGLRTVSGRLDASDYKEGLSAYYEGGLNPVDYAGTLAHLPQYHFIGEDDKADMIKLYHNFAQAVGPSWCMRHSLIPDANDDRGWVEQWSDLVALPLDCHANKQNGKLAPEVDLTPVPFNPKTLDIMDDMHGKGKK
ncbi:MAG: hypothetical protein ACTHPO_06130 [Alphaproteobacteria bacterium]